MLITEENIIDQFRNISAGKSYREMAQDIGMSHSRLYRIFNGSEMKVGEYRMLRRAINAKNNPVLKKRRLLLIEKMILESLESRPKTVMEISQDTSIPLSLISNIIPSLMMRSLIQYRNPRYVRSSGNREDEKDEVKELFVTLVNSYFCQNHQQAGPQLQWEKVWMTPLDQLELEKHHAALKRLIDRIKLRDSVNTGKQGPLCRQRVVFWGDSEYSQLVNSYLAAV